MNNFPKDLFIKISIELELPDIFELSSVNKKFNNLTCENDIFWMNKFYYDYGYYSKVSNSTWKEFYKYITITHPYNLLWIGIDKNILSYVVCSLKRGYEINSSSFYSPLYRASKKGRLEIVKYLIKQGANVSACNYLAFRQASRKGHLEVVKYLVERGANIHAENDEALRCAKQYKKLDVVDYLNSLL